MKKDRLYCLRVVATWPASSSRRVKTLNSVALVRLLRSTMCMSLQVAGM